MKKTPTWVFFVVAGFILLMGYTAIFGITIPLPNAYEFHLKGSPEIRYGIDIRGGVDAVFESEDPNYIMTEAELNSAQQKIEMRLDAKNILDRDISIDKENRRILVRFPWKQGEASFNPQQALLELGEMAHLTFRDPEGNIVVEGKNVKSSSAGYEATNGNVVYMTFDSEGATKFAEATQRLIGQHIAIMMDETTISSPTVEVAIPNGQAIITKIGSAQEAKELAAKINAGALPVKLISRTNSSISPSLGTQALDVMVLAGGIAFIAICIFMLLYYRLSGFIAVIALIGQTAGQLLMISIPQMTLTLPGIAGIILSIGMGVDANIIISERVREELTEGKTIRMAIRTGYHRAFSAVADGNVTVAIAAILLIMFGSGAILSFGYSLLIGVILNTIMGVTASRLMSSALCNLKPMQAPWLYRKKRRLLQ